MDALEKLEKAREHMEEARILISEANSENESLENYYGYSLTIVEQQLDIFSSNERNYMTSSTNLEEIIEGEGDKWSNIR